MRKDLTDVTIVMDRSGSMQLCKEEAENGVNQFVEEQKLVEGDCVFTLIEFDNNYRITYNCIPIEEVPKYSLTPGGFTALLDAIGKAVTEAGDRISAMREENRPGLVVVVIVTDGAENASKEFAQSTIRQMVKTQQEDYSWKFVFLGANQNAFKTGNGIGINADSCTNFEARKADKAYQGTSDNLTRMRTATKLGNVVTGRYTSQERKEMGK